MKNKAFTLLEMAIVITVIALISIPAVDFLLLSQRNSDLEKTRSKMSIISAALSQYAKDNNNRLPLPTDINSPLIGSNPNQNNLSGIDCYVNADYGFNRYQLDNGGGAHGSVPYDELEISAEYAVDSWNNKVEYYVNCSVTTGTRSDLAPTYFVDNVDLDVTAPSENATFVLVSHGPDGLGAYNVNTNTKDTTNTDNDFFGDPATPSPSGMGGPSLHFQASKGSNGDIIFSSNRGDILSSLFGRVSSGYDSGSLSLNVGGLLTAESNLSVTGTSSFTGNITASTGNVNIQSGNLQIGSWTIEEESTGNLVFKDDNVEKLKIEMDGDLKERVSISGDRVFLGTYWRILENTSNQLEFSESSSINGSYILPDQGTTNILITSDRRLKENITSVNSNLSLINQLKPSQYHWKGQSRGERLNFGFIAQDVKKVFPNLVAKGEDGYYRMYYQDLIAPTIAALQELDLKVEKQIPKKGEIKILANFSKKQISKKHKIVFPQKLKKKT